MNRKLGRYTLLQKLRSGGMAEVYLGVVDGPGDFRRKVALKAVLPCFAEDPEFRTMFMDEAAIGARLTHANIAQIYDFDIEDGVPYLAMEYIEGKDLRSILERCGQLNRGLPWQTTAAIILEVAKGLYYVHTKREFSRPLLIVHRDVSPQNIMISFGGEVKLLDFGIAKAAGSLAVTSAGQVKGKNAYMSPEQALGHPVDARSDLFSLGVVFWELLTGRRLFGDDNEAATIRKLMACEVPPPHTLNPKVPKEVSALVLACLGKEPKDRFPSVLQLYEKLSSQLFSRPTEPGSNALVGLLAELFPEDIVGYLEGLHPWAAREPGPDGEATRKLGNAAGQPPQGAPPAGPPPTPSGYIPWDQVPPRISRLPRLPQVQPSRWLILAAGLAAVVAVMAWLLILLPASQHPRADAELGDFAPPDNSRPAQEMKPVEGPQRPPEDESSEAATPGQINYPEGAPEGEGLQQGRLELLALEAKVPVVPDPQADPQVDQTQVLDEAREAWRAARRGPRQEQQAPPPAAPPSPRTAKPARPLPAETGQEAPPKQEVPAAVPAVQATPEMGLVFISPDPWAEIYIDGKFVARNGDPKNYPVTVGRHRIKLRHLSQTHRCTVTVEPDQRPECKHQFEREEAANPGRLRP